MVVLSRLACAHTRNVDAVGGVEDSRGEGVLRVFVARTVVGELRVLGKKTTTTRTGQ